MRNATKVMVFLTALAPLANGADEKTEGKYGLKPGDLIPGAFHPYVVTGSWTDRFHCLVCEHGLNPTVIVFAREAPEEGQPLADLLRGLDAAVAKRLAKDKLGAFAVFLSEGGRDALKSKLQGLAAAKDKELKNVALAIDNEAGDSGLKRYAIDKSAEVVVVLYRDHKVVANHTFSKGKFSANDVKAILADVNAKLAPVRKTS